MKNCLGNVLVAMTLVLTVMLGAGTAAFAHVDSKGPHGGVVKEFGNFHMEGVLDGGSVKFYLLDGDGAKGTSTEIAGGSVTVLSGGSSPKVTKIEKGKFAEVSASADGKKVTASIMLKIGGKNQSAKYSFK